MDYKNCSKCGKFLPATTGYFYRSGKNGLRSSCKECYKIYTKQYYEKNSDDIKTSSKQRYLINSECIKEKHKIYYKENKSKTLEQCKRWYAINSEYKKKYRVKHYDSKQAREYYKNNIESIKEKTRKYQKSDKGRLVAIRKSHKRRVSKYENGGFYTNAQWIECLNFFNNQCAYTGRDLNSQNTNVDHLIPVSKGGTNDIWNLVPSIDYANKSKSNKSIEDWYINQDYFSERRLQKIYEWVNYSKQKYNKNLKEIDKYGKS